MLPFTGCAEQEPGDILVISAAPLIQIPLDVRVKSPPAPTDNSVDIRAVHGAALVNAPTTPLHTQEETPATLPVEPPAELLERLPDASRNSLLRMWDNLPQHFRDVDFDFHGPGWTPAVIDELSAVLI